MATVEITSENFEQTVEKGGIVLLDFWAGWCAPCRMFGPIYEGASNRHQEVVFGKVDTEAQQQLAGEFGIRSIPTVMAFKDGIPVFAQPGVLPAPMLDKLIEQLVALDMNEVRKQIAEHTHAAAEAKR